jgi:hypothetical protein
MQQPASPQYSSYGGEGYDDVQHRLSNKDRPLSPDLSSQFPESVLASEGDKEVAYNPPQPLPYQRPDAPRTSDNRRVCGVKSSLFYGLLVLLIIFVALGIGLGVGLGVGLGTKHVS